MKSIKVICILTVFFLIFCPVTFAWSSESDDFYTLTGSSGFDNDETAAEQVIESVQPMPSYDGAAAILIERNTGKVIYEYNADTPRPIASITKIMTMILVMEAIERGDISLDDPVATSEHAYSMGGSQIWLEPGEIMSVNELLKAVAVASANDAAVALAEHVSGSEEAFVADMNRRAAELGMVDTTFKNANGLDEEGHISSARDVALMSREVLRHELVRNYISIWMDELRGGETQLTNTNKMLKTFNGMTGIKTGTTNRAGVCLSGSAERDGMELIAVILGSSNSQSRFSAVKTLLEYGFSYYELAALNLDESALGDVRVKLGVGESCQYTYELPSNILVSRGQKDGVVCEVELGDTVEAPVEPSQVLGEIKVYVGGELAESYPITATEGIERIDFGSGFKLLVGSLFDM